MKYEHVLDLLMKLVFFLWNCTLNYSNELHRYDKNMIISERFILYSLHIHFIIKNNETMAHCVEAKCHEKTLLFPKMNTFKYVYIN